MTTADEPVNRAVTDAEHYSIEWWKGQHRRGYFEKLRQHQDWRIYDAMPEWFGKLAKPTEDDFCLEIGCGYGEWMIPLAKIVDGVDGFDIDQRILDIAQRKFVHHGVSAKCAVTLGDGVTIPMDDRYDLIYCISVFQHIPRSLVLSYMRQAHGLLADYGRVLFHFRFAGGGGTWSEDIVDGHRKEFSVGWTCEQIIQATGDAGFVGEVFVMGQSVVFSGCRLGGQ